MNALNRLPGFQRSSPGREWVLFKRLPAILLLGTALPTGLALALWWVAPGLPSAAEQRDLLLWTYQLIGLVVLHWTLVLTVAIGCTGGRHRSVYLVERLAERLRERHPLIVRHRDLARD